MSSDEEEKFAVLLGSAIFSIGITPSQLAMECHIIQNASGDSKVFLQLCKLDNSAFIWMSTDGALTEVALSFPPKYDSLPTTKTILHSGSLSDTSALMAAKLIKKLGFPIILSCNGVDSLHPLWKDVECKILDLLRK